MGLRLWRGGKWQGGKGSFSWIGLVFPKCAKPFAVGDEIRFAGFEIGEFDFSKAVTRSKNGLEVHLATDIGTLAVANMLGCGWKNLGAEFGG